MSNMAKHINLGVMFRREQAPESLPAYARRVEELGFDELWVVEDWGYLGGISQATAALAATERITVGLGIVPAVARNAAFLAMEFATLARMYPGRFHGGIGHGVAEWMDQVGARPASWLASIEETTSAVRAIMRGENLNVDGRYVRLRDVQLEDAPEQVPPVSLGVRGPKSLEVAGRSADGTILAENSAPAYVTWAREHIARGVKAAGRTDHHRVTVYANAVVSATDPDGAREVAREASASMLGGEASVQTSMLPYADDLARVAREGPKAYRDEWLDDLAIAGSPEQGVAAIQRLAAAGADAIVVVPPVGTDYDAWLEDVANLVSPRR